MQHRLTGESERRALGQVLDHDAFDRAALSASDLYVIEPRAFHGDHARLIGHYDTLREQRGCAMNLDLQRFAVPTTANSAQHSLGLPAIDPAEQARWILEGRKVQRIVVEDMGDSAAFWFAGRPVLHMADLALEPPTS